MDLKCHANGTLVEDALGNTVATVNGINDPGDNQRIARRIVAALNACAGISTEALESGALREALDAGKSAVAPIRNSLDAGKWTPYSPEILALERALSKLGAPTYACPECGKADDKPECDCREDRTDG